MDIEVITESDVQGNIFIIGDVHGCYELLLKVLSKLTPDDILIITGDLIDRGEMKFLGPSTALVLNMLIEYKNAPRGTRPQIFCIMGNHEMDFLAVYNLLNRVKHSNEPPSAAAINMLLSFFKNGGGWICRETLGNVDHQERLLYFRALGFGDASPECKANAFKYAAQILDALDPFSELIPEIHAYKAFIKTLPFVLQIKGPHPAWIVHADLNFTDEELEGKIASAEPIKFTNLELRHLIDTRIKQLPTEKKRNKHSTLVVVGHNVISSPDHRSYLERVLPVRTETNHINLDGGAYYRNAFLLMNLTEYSIEVVGKDISDNHLPILTYAKDAIQTHLNELHYTSQCGKNNSYSV